MVALLRAYDAALVAFADEVGADDAVTVVGGRSQWLVGGPPAAAAREVRAPGGVVGYLPEEMTVAVRAGTTVAELRASLAEHGQECALPDPSLDGTATVGGVIAVGHSGINRLGIGPLRDAVLQVRYVSAEGRLVTGGGPTVKNVTGFDLPRLLVGSLGTIGVLAEVILRTRPRAGVSMWLCASGVDPLAVFGALYRPQSVLFDGSSVWAQLAGHRGDVTAQRSLLEGLGPFAEVDGPPTLPPHRWSLDPGDALLFKADGPFVVEVGIGTVHASEPQPVRRVAAPVAELHRRLKANFDPTGRLNPGRDPLAAPS